MINWRGISIVNITPLTKYLSSNNFDEIKRKYACPTYQICRPILTQTSSLSPKLAVLQLLLKSVTVVAIKSFMTKMDL